MSPSDLIIDANFLEYVNLQLRRHGLLMVGGEQGPEFDELEGRMTELWEEFDAVHRQSVNGMASDLNWIRRNGQRPPKGPEAGDVTEDDRRKLLASRDSKDWHGFLHYMRICASIIPTSRLAYLRGDAYDAIGLRDYAAAFHEYAVELAPSGPRAGVSRLFPGTLPP